MIDLFAYRKIRNWPSYTASYSYIGYITQSLETQKHYDKS